MNTTTSAISTKGKWSIDQVHSNLNFTVDHLVISQVTGSFSTYNGVINNSGDDLSEASIEFSIDVNSLDTRNEMRDNHLKSDDFFNAEAYPHIHFESDNIEQLSDSEYAITGKMRIRDIEREVTFKARVGGVAVDGYGNTKLGMKVTTSINRFDYNLKWNQMTEAGGMVVGKTVEINAQLQFGKE